MTKQEIIEETVEYYKNNPFGYDLNRDGISEGGCVYYGPNKQMCAVGRCLIDPTNTNIIFGSVTSIGRNNNLDDLLKEQYRGHDLSFWQELQSFHDKCATDELDLENCESYLKQYYGE